MNTKMRRYLKVGGVRLCCVDFGGDGPPVLLLHGLAGRGLEWRESASWLREHYHVYALDQRGHGMSDKGLNDYSRDAYVKDVISVIEQLQVQPVLLIGQSMGGQNAYLVASRRPDLVCGLIVVEATVSPDPDKPDVQGKIRKWLHSWPLPFPSLADARAYFGGDTLYAQTWLEILEERSDGFWPQFHFEDMISSVADQGGHDYTDEWLRIQCPALLVGGEKSFLPQEKLCAMAQQLPHARYVQIANADHDLHLSQPQVWRQEAEAFLRNLDHIR
ncbi:alpha/beta fold hydrolase [Ktedonobacter robiniae]|uniref:AB hydrolase-1 domain-containing protein n=1 Tax=Ktedonobacter robiniae TaxID=2778365 RepID=A0ABQ3UX88_9CHLR|nr:alpha/beta hydrolase [Ktedonobacter robiniae]GHO56950.1 hypothetical protein KSB_54250 [Ktedonobacter robiniae]